MRSSGGLSGVAKQEGTGIMGRKETIRGIYKNREVYVCVCVCVGGGGLSVCVCEGGGGVEGTGDCDCVCLGCRREWG